MGELNNINSSYFDDLYVYLQKFVKISRLEFNLLVPLFQIRAFNKKTVILQQGEMEDYLNMVVKGLVRKYIRSSKGEITLQLATEGHFIHSEISFHHREPSPVALETIESSVLVSIKHEHVQLALENIPGAEELGRTIIMQMFIKKDNRYFDQLKRTTRQRFLEYMESHPHMLQRVPQKILASYLDIKPETFSRLKHLVKAK
jgi:CRP-like cAMP-binding protein